MVECALLIGFDEIITNIFGWGLLSKLYRMTRMGGGPEDFWGFFEKLTQEFRPVWEVPSIGGGVGGCINHCYLMVGPRRPYIIGTFWSDPLQLAA